MFTSKKNRKRGGGEMTIKERFQSIFGLVLDFKDVVCFLSLTDQQQKFFWHKIIKLIAPFKKDKTNGEAKLCYENNGKFYDLQIYCKFKYNIWKRVDILVFNEISEDEFLDKVIEYKKITRK